MFKDQVHDSQQQLWRFVWRGGGSQPLPESGGRAEPRPEGGHGGAGHGDHQPDPGAGAPSGA